MRAPLHSKKGFLRTKRAYVVLFLCILFVGMVTTLGYHERVRIDHFLYGTPKVSTPTMPTTSLPTRPAANNGNKELTTPQGVTQQPAVDNQGQAPSSVPSNESQWLTSASGVITVKLPTENTTFKSGDKLYGSGSVSSVQYRLIDDVIGVISQGTISVVNGNFSATVNFVAQGKTGRLDVFSTDAQGRELNEVQVPIKL